MINVSDILMIHYDSCSKALQN